MNSEKIWPADLDAEAALLKELLVGEQSLKLVRPFLLPEHFYSEAHRRIYEAIVAVAGQGGGDKCVIRVGHWLKNRGRIEQVGGMGYITRLFTDVESKPGNVQIYGEIIYDKWRVRQAIKIGDEIRAGGFTDYGKVQDYIESGADKLAKLARAAIGGPVESNAAKLRKAIAELGGIGSGKALGVYTGIRAYDALTRGLMPKTKNTFVALTGVGKTIAAVQTAVAVARRNIGVLYFSTESPAHEMIFRIIQHISGIWVPRAIESGLPARPGVDMAKLFTDTCEEVGRLPIHFDDIDDLTPEHVRSTSELWIDRMRQTKGAPLGLVVVDYVQRMTPSRDMLKKSTYDQHCYATRSLKNLAKELSIPVLELAQEKTPERVKQKNGTFTLATPTEQDTAECKVIGKEADTLTFFRRIGDGSDRTAIMMHLLKQRTGPAGVARRLELQLQRGYFETIDEEAA